MTRGAGSAVPRSAVITGGSEGLGRALAGFLAGEGYRLLLTARRAEPLARAARELTPIGAGVETVGGDVADPATRAEIVARVGQWGQLDLLVNNASELGPSPLPELRGADLTDFRRVLEVNVVAPVALTQALLPALETARGRVVNISSDAATGGYPGWGLYGAGKAALDLVSKTWAAELQNSGVSVVSVDPGDMRTRMHQAAYPGQDISDRPLPDTTLPFWAWLLQQEPAAVSGHRYRAQSDRWESP